VELSAWACASEMCKEEIKRKHAPLHEHMAKKRGEFYFNYTLDMHAGTKTHTHPRFFPERPFCVCCPPTYTTYTIREEREGTHGAKKGNMFVCVWDSSVTKGKFSRLWGDRAKGFFHNPNAHIYIPSLSKSNKNECVWGEYKGKEGRVEERLGGKRRRVDYIFLPPHGGRAP